MTAAVGFVGAPPTREVVLDPAVVRELRTLDSPGERGFFEQLVGQFVDETVPLLAQLRLAVEQEDASSVRRIAHKLRGSSSQMGARRLASSYATLETAAAAGSLIHSRRDLRAVETDYGDIRSVLALELAPTRSFSYQAYLSRPKRLRVAELEVDAELETGDMFTHHTRIYEVREVKPGYGGFDAIIFADLAERESVSHLFPDSA